MAKRKGRIEVVWTRSGLWLVKCKVFTPRDSSDRGHEFSSRKFAVKAAKWYKDEMLRCGWDMVQIIIHGMKKKITAEWTYPRSMDPRRSKG